MTESQSARHTENYQCERCEEWFEETQYCDTYLDDDGTLTDGYLCEGCWVVYSVPTGGPL